MDSQKVYGQIRRLSTEKKLLRKQRNLAWEVLDCTYKDLMAAKKELAMVNAMNSAAKRKLDREMAALLRSRAECNSAHLANAELQRKVNRLSNELEVALNKRNMALATARNAMDARNFAVVAFATVCAKPVDVMRTERDGAIDAMVMRQMRSVQLMICTIICVIVAFF